MVKNKYYLSLRGRFDRGNPISNDGDCFVSLAMTFIIVIVEFGT